MSSHLFDSYRYTTMMLLGAERTERVRRADELERSSEYHLETAHRLGRPDYREAPRFTRQDGFNVKGLEKPYGPGSREFWRAVWRSARAAFLSGVHDARGTEDVRVVPDRRRHAVIANITS